MHFSNLSSFFAMGGYAIYVWPAFFLTWLCFAVMVIHSIRQKKILLRLVLVESDRKKRIEEKRHLDKELEGGDFHES